MEKVTISEIKNRLSAYLQKVRAGRGHKAETPLKLLRGAVPKPGRSVTQALLDERSEGR